MQNSFNCIICTISFSHFVFVFYYLIKMEPGRGRRCRHRHRKGQIELKMKCDAYFKRVAASTQRRLPHRQASVAIESTIFKTQAHSPKRPYTRRMHDLCNYNFSKWSRCCVAGMKQILIILSITHDLFAHRTHVYAPDGRMDGHDTLASQSHWRREWNLGFRGRWWPCTIFPFRIKLMQINNTKENTNAWQRLCGFYIFPNIFSLLPLFNLVHFGCLARRR